ncbi:MAG: ATP-binding protein [Magnetovibrionaceae bacterium]
MRIKDFLPKSLLGRAVLIIVSPLILLQVVSAAIFFESHWDKVARRLARDVAGDIGFLAEVQRGILDPGQRANVMGESEHKLHMTVVIKKGEILPNEAPPLTSPSDFQLAEALKAYVGKPFHIDSQSFERHVLVSVQLKDAVMDVIVSRKRLYSSTTYVFVTWMVGTSVLLFAVAMIFMRNQVRPIRRLAQAADAFGKGRRVEGFKPEGAAEVRQAGSAFAAMRDRIIRHIGQRTDMLSGVSHDLRTPLTRMKLQLAMLEGVEGTAELKSDVDDMERMLEGYLAFARGEGGEKAELTELKGLLGDVVTSARRKGGTVDLHVEGDLIISAKPHGLKRCITNLVDNALRHAGHVNLRAGRRGDSMEIMVDDDGPGIPEDQREEVFKPFVRLDRSRNADTGGVGLGLSIARDIVRAHGGDIELADSPIGGLRVRLRLPV